jgi:Protein of unknown function (DUF2934)
MASRRPTDSPRSPVSAPTTPTTAPESPPPAAKAKAPTVRKPRARKAATPKGATVVAAAIEISEEVRRGMIAEAAYLRAERRGFVGGHDKEREDWLAAEAEVEALLKAGHGTSAQ